jgi:hypothetical protein
VTVLAVSSDSGQATQTLTYTVQPDNAFTTTPPTAGKHGKLSFGLKLPGAGRVRVTETTAGGKRVTIASTSKDVTGERTLHIALKPTKPARALLAGLKKGETLAAKLTISFTPKKGVTRTSTVTGIALKP